MYKDFPGGPAVRNPPSSAEDRDLIPRLGRVHTPEKLSLCSTPLSPGAHALRQEKPPQGGACPSQLEKALAQLQRPSTAQNEKVTKQKRSGGRPNWATFIKKKTHTQKTRNTKIKMYKAGRPQRSSG